MSWDAVVGTTATLAFDVVTALPAASPNVPEPTECAQRIRDLVGTARACIIEIGGEPRL